MLPKVFVSSHEGEKRRLHWIICPLIWENGWGWKADIESQPGQIVWMPLGQFYVSAIALHLGRDFPLLKINQIHTNYLEIQC
jgi:hypothetical protein